MTLEAVRRVEKVSIHLDVKFLANQRGFRRVHLHRPRKQAADPADGIPRIVERSVHLRRGADPLHRSEEEADAVHVICAHIDRLHPMLVLGAPVVVFEPH